MLWFSPTLRLEVSVKPRISLLTPYTEHTSSSENFRRFKNSASVILSWSLITSLTHSMTALRWWFFPPVYFPLSSKSLICLRNLSSSSPSGRVKLGSSTTRLEGVWLFLKNARLDSRASLSVSRSTKSERILLLPSASKFKSLSVLRWKISSLVNILIPPRFW